MRILQVKDECIIMGTSTPYTLMPTGLIVEESGPRFYTALGRLPVLVLIYCNHSSLKSFEFITATESASNLLRCDTSLTRSKIGTDIWSIRSNDIEPFTNSVLVGNATSTTPYHFLEVCLQKRYLCTCGSLRFLGLQMACRGTFPLHIIRFSTNNHTTTESLSFSVSANHNSAQHTIFLRAVR